MSGLGMAGLILATFGMLVAMAYYLSRPDNSPNQSRDENPLMIAPANASKSVMNQLAVEHPDWMIRGGQRLRASNVGPHKFFVPSLEPEWMEYNASSAGQLLGGYLRSNRVRSLPAIDKPPPSTEPVNVPEIRLIATSRIEFTGTLTNRVLQTPLRLQSWTNTDVLPPSVVQVSVNPAGMVLHARLLQSSRLADADKTAIGLAQGARFRPLPGGETNLFATDKLATGSFVFRWHTVASAVTNILEPEFPPRTVLPR